MSGAGLVALAPLAALGLGGISAMVLAPVARAGVVGAVGGGALLLAVALVALRAGAPAAELGTLLADDGLARFGAGLAILTGLGALVASRAEGGVREAPALIAIATAGAVVLVAARHGATLFLGLEIMTLAILALAVAPRTPEAIEAGYKLFLLAGAGASSLLLGLGFGFAASGGVGFGDLSAAGPIGALAGALLFAGLAVKFGLVPFHMWVPDLFAGAPVGASLLVAATSKVAVGLALLRLTLEVPGGPPWTGALAVTGAAAVLLGNVAALTQSGLLRMLGYSAVAHSGYLALILATGLPRAGEAVVVYLAGHAVAAVAALCAAATAGPSGSIETLRGLLWRRPVIGAALIVALLSMAGLPPTFGFMGKAYLFAVLAEAEAYLLLGVAGLGAAVGFAVYMRFVVVIAALRNGAADSVDSGRVGMAGDPATSLVVMVAIASLLVAGLFPEPVLSLARAVGAG